MTREEKTLLKIYNKTQDEKIKKTLGVLLEEEDEEEKEELVKEEPKEKETKEEEESKEVEPKEEPKQEEKQIDIKKIAQEVMGLMEEKFKPYVTKKELEEIKKEIPKAQDFGANPTAVSVEDNDFEKSREKILKNLN